MLALMKRKLGYLCMPLGISGGFLKAHLDAKPYPC